MALKLYGTSIALPAPFVAGSCDPVDVRLVAENFSDITTNAGDTFGTVGEYCKVYEGIQVYISADKTTYMYVGPAVKGSGILLTEVQKTENWRKISDSESSADKVSETLDDLQTQITQAKVKNTDGSITVGAEEADGTPISVKLKADNNALKLDAENGLYVDESVLTKYTGSNAISVTGDEPNKVINLVINSSDKVLTQSGDGLLANINLTWDKADGLKLVGKDGAEIATIPATDFIKDGMLENVTLEENPGGQAAGTYLHFVFNTDAKKTDIYVNVTELIDIYTGSNGVQVSGKNISAVRDSSSESFLSIGASGIKVSGVQDAINTAQQTVQKAIDKVELSVGLATDGSHVPTSGNYTSGASTVVGEIAALDTQVKTNEVAIAAETSRATAEETRITDTVIGEDQLEEGKSVMDVILENEETAQQAIEQLATAAGVLSGEQIKYTAPTVSGEFSSTTSIMDMLNTIDEKWNTIDCGTY